MKEIKHWRLGIVLIIGFLSVTFRDFLPEWLKVILIITIVGGTIFSALNEF